jgi:hypothetical protein
MNIIVTTSLINSNYEERKCDYIDGINSLINEISKFADLNIKTNIYIVENNGKRKTFLDDFIEKSDNKININIKVIYTNHKQINCANKGFKELLDIAFILNETRDEIDDNDIFIKLTGRYRVGEECAFLNFIYNHKHLNEYDAFIRNGAFMFPSQKKIDRDNYDCLTGLFAMRAKIMRCDMDYFIKNIKEYEWFEWIISMIIQSNVPQNRIKYFDYLGLWIKTAYMKEFNLF